MTRDQQVILQFVQGINEPFYIAWERYQVILRNFPNHGFSREGQVLNFLDGLTAATRTWVEGGTGTTSLYDLTADEANFQLAEIAGYDYQLWNPPKAYRHFEEEANNSARWQDPSSLQMNCYKSNEELSTNEGECEIVYDGNSIEDETKALLENNESLSESSPLEIHIIIPPPFVKEYSYEDPMWPAPSPPSFGPFFEASQAHPSKRSSLAHTFIIKLNFVKLEGVYNLEPWDVLYDTYYGRTPLFDDLGTISQLLLHQEDIVHTFGDSTMHPL